MKTRFAPWLVAGLCMSLLSACSRTVTWEEEVPLNTGEVIWVERSMPWIYKGGFGNPFDIAMRPTREQTIRFRYSGNDYVYTGRADIRWIAISPTGVPALVAPAASFGWASANNYTCVTPYYVQLVPDISGNRWTWPKQIEPWLYDLRANVMASIPQLDEKLEQRYSSTTRDQRDATYRLQFPEGSLVNPLYQEKSGCVHKYDPSLKPNWSTK